MMMVVNILTCIFEALLITMVFNAYGTDDSSKRMWRFGVLSVVFLSCTARVQIHALRTSHRDVDERAVFVAAQNNSNRMLAKNEMEI